MSCLGVPSVGDFGPLMNRNTLETTLSLSNLRYDKFTATVPLSNCNKQENNLPNMEWYWILVWLCGKRSHPAPQMSVTAPTFECTVWRKFRPLSLQTWHDNWILYALSRHDICLLGEYLNARSKEWRQPAVLTLHIFICFMLGPWLSRRAFCLSRRLYNGKEKVKIINWFVDIFETTSPGQKQKTFSNPMTS